jgi:hypothetical protein
LKLMAYKVGPCRDAALAVACPVYRTLWEGDE